MKKIFTTLVIVFLGVYLFASTNVYAPALQTPTDSAENQMPNVLLNWQAVVGGFGLTYLVHIDTDVQFANPIALTTNLSAVNTNELVFGQQYFWRVKAYDNTDTSDWSVTRSFTVIEKTSFKALATNTWSCYYSTFTNNNFVEWLPITGITHYEYQIDTIASFNSTFLINDTTSSNKPRYFFGQELYSNKAYYIRVRGIHAQDQSAWSVPFTFKICNFMPGAPELNLPANASTNQPATLHLDWVPLVDATSYVIQYDTDNTFSNPVIEIFTPTTTNIMTLNNSRISISNLNEGTTYFWRVKAVKGVEETIWSNVWSFSTVDTVVHAPSIPVLEMPEDLALDVYPSVLLTWEDDINATSYIYEYDTDNLFTSAISDTVTDNHIWLEELMFGDTYFWRIKALNASNITDWSIIRSFTVIEHPVLTTPHNNSLGNSLNVNLDWEIITGANDYNLQIDTDILFNTAGLIDTIITSAYIFENAEYNTEYFWRLRAMHDADTSVWSSVWAFNIKDTMPAAPDLLKPFDATADVHPNVSLEWTIVDGATSYMIQVDNDMLFVTTDTLTAINENIDVDTLMFGETYFWRVKAIGANDTSDWSAVYSFTIIEKPSLLSPADGAIEQLPILHLTWEGVEGGVEYIVEVAEDMMFTNAYSEITTDEILELENLLFGQTYFWRIKAISANDTSDFSDIFNFTIIETIEAISPSNGIVTSLANIFKWETIAGVVSYQCEIDTTISFNSPKLVQKHVNADIPEVQAFASQSLFGTTYYWRVRAIHSADTSAWSLVKDFTTSDMFELVSPSNGAVNMMPTVNLRSENLFGTSNYQFELDTADTFDSFMYALSFTFGGLPFVNSTNNELLFGTKYYWRARARIGSSFSNWTNTWEFTTIDKPSLILPVDGAQLFTQVFSNNTWQFVNVTFRWQEIGGITHSVLQYDTLPDFSTAVSHDVNAPVNQLVVPYGNFGTGTYYWRVKSVHSKDESEWSDTRTFNYSYNVGIGESGFANNLNMYPNPTNGEVTVEVILENAAAIDMQILDITGRIVYSEAFSLNQGLNTMPINLSFLSQGIYIVNFKNSDISLNRKLILNN